MARSGLSGARDVAVRRREPRDSRPGFEGPTSAARVRLLSIACRARTKRRTASRPSFEHSQASIKEYVEKNTMTSFRCPVVPRCAPAASLHLCPNSGKRPNLAKILSNETRTDR